MRIREFTDKHCMDIVKESKQVASYLDSDDFSYDAVIEDIDGTPIKIIYAGPDEIPISDVLTLDKKDFIKIHPTLEASEAYDNYVESIIMLDGEEALSFIRNEVMKERSKIETYSKFVDSI